MISKQLLSLSQEKLIDIYVAGKPIGKGEIKNGVTIVPLRIISEALGAKVTCDPKANRVDIQK